ncbi:MAG: hypothetical protein HQM06_17145 [Magnetococcales bacterium]|nr:hypothetical protein [Magnetococcales bacterium]
MLVEVYISPKLFSQMAAVADQLEPFRSPTQLIEEIARDALEARLEEVIKIYIEQGGGDSD